MDTDLIWLTWWNMGYIRLRFLHSIHFGSVQDDTVAQPPQSRCCPRVWSGDVGGTTNDRCRTAVGMLRKQKRGAVSPSMCCPIYVDILLLPIFWCSSPLLLRNSFSFSLRTTDYVATSPPTTKTRNTKKKSKIEPVETNLACLVPFPADFGIIE